MQFDDEIRTLVMVALTLIWLFRPLGSLFSRSGLVAGLFGTVEPATCFFGIVDSFLRISQSQNLHLQSHNITIHMSIGKFAETTTNLRSTYYVFTPMKIRSFVLFWSDITLYISFTLKN